MDPICSSKPLPSLRMCGRAARFTRNTPKTLVSNCWWTCLRVNASSGPLYDTPALLTTTSRRPVIPTRDAIACSTEASSVISISMIYKASCSRCASARSSSAAGAFFPATARIPAKTVYPWRARVSTVRRPKPLVLPVTRIVCAIGMLPFYSKTNERIYAHLDKKLAHCLLQFGEQRQERPKLLFPQCRSHGLLCVLPQRIGHVESLPSLTRHLRDPLASILAWREGNQVT